MPGTSAWRSARQPAFRSAVGDGAGVDVDPGCVAVAAGPALGWPVGAVVEQARSATIARTPATRSRIPAIDEILRLRSIDGNPSRI
jgi:hypothetical protein